MHDGINCLIDTFAWRKLDHLYLHGWRDEVLDIIIQNNILVTREVWDELMYRWFKILEEDILDHVTLLPKIEIDYRYYENQGFDRADASLIEYSRTKNIFVVTEDHPMLALGVVDKLDFIQTIDFLYLLYRFDRLTKNQMIKLVREFRSLKNITKKKEKSILHSMR